MVLGCGALIGRFGAPARRGEERAIADVLGSLVQLIAAVQSPGTLEGGDLLRVGRRIVVGRSRRTNDAGIEALRCFAEPLGWEVCTAQVPSWALHLQTAATRVGDRIVLGPKGGVNLPACPRLVHVWVPYER